MAQTASAAQAVAETGDSSTPRTKPRRGLFSKLIRSAALAAGEEFIASRWTGSQGISSRVPKMALYGALVNTTITHLLLRTLRAIFGSKGRLAQILTLFIAVPVQKVAHFLSLSYAHGARTFSQMRHTVQRSLFPSMAVLLFLGAGSLAFAQIFLPQRTWPRFFQHMSFLISTLDNVFAKRVIRTAERRDEMREERREERREAQRRVETRGKKRETQRRADTDEREGGGMESSPSSVETTRARPRKPA